MSSTYTINMQRLRKEGLEVLKEDDIVELCKDIILSRIKRIETLEGKKYEFWKVRVRAIQNDIIEMIAIPNNERSIYKVPMKFCVETIYNDIVLQKMNFQTAFARAFRPISNEELCRLPKNFRKAKEYIIITNN